MAETEEKKKKQASLDSENIPAVQRTESKKVSLDTEGVTRKASDAEKMSLDMDGVVVEKKGSSKIRKTSEDKKQEAEQGADTEEKTQRRLVERFKALPLKKVVVIMIGFVLAASAALVSYSYLMRTKESAGTDRSKALTEQARDGDAQLQESHGQELPLELEPFIIALTNNVKTALLRITVLLQTRQCYEHHIINQKKTVRLAIYDILVKINAEEVLDSKRQEEIKSEILRKVNAILGESIIEDVSFKDLVLA